jgi:hypothetical protein
MITQNRPEVSATGTVIGELGQQLLICTEILPKNGRLLHSKLTRLRLPGSLKT